MEKGIPYDTILTFSDNELRTVLAVKQALDERKQEEIDKMVNRAEMFDEL